MNAQLMDMNTFSDAEDHSNRSSFSIMLVDDNADDVVLAIEAIHEFEGVRVCVTAENGLEAIEVLSSVGKHEHLPDLVLMDINMPTLNGFEALQRIRKVDRFRDLAVVIFTSSNRIEDQIAAYAAGANACVRKPDTFKNLKQSLMLMIGFFSLSSTQC